MSDVLQSPVSILIDSAGNIIGSKDEGSSVFSLNTNIRSGGVKIYDAAGNIITGTALSDSRKSIDVTASLSDPTDVTKKVTVKDETEEYPDVYSLDCNIRSGIVQVKLSGANLVYTKLTEDLPLTNGSYVTVYDESTEGGKIIWAWMRFDNNDVDVKLTVDSNVLIDGFNCNSLYSKYKLDDSFYSGGAPDFLQTREQGRIFVLMYEGGLEYETQFKIETMANRNNLNMIAGLVVRSLE